LEDRSKNPRVTVTLGQPVVAGAGGLMPDLRGKTKRQAIALLAPLGVRVNFRGQGLVRGQLPLPGVSVPNGAACDLSCETQASIPFPSGKRSGT